MPHTFLFFCCCIIIVAVPLALDVPSNNVEKSERFLRSIVDENMMAMRRSIVIVAVIFAKWCSKHSSEVIKYRNQLIDMCTHIKKREHGGKIYIFKLLFGILLGCEWWWKTSPHTYVLLLLLFFLKNVLHHLMSRRCYVLICFWQLSLHFWRYRLFLTLWYLFVHLIIFEWLKHKGNMLLPFVTRRLDNVKTSFTKISKLFWQTNKSLCNGLKRRNSVSVCTGNNEWTMMLINK